MNAQEAFRLLSKLVSDKTGVVLDDTHSYLIQGAWEGKTYKDIKNDYSVRPKLGQLMNTGSELWRLLSRVLGRKVDIKNIRVPVNAWIEQQEALPQPRQDERETLLPNQELDFQHPAEPYPPLTEPKFPEGPVPLDSAFYVERPPTESDCNKEIMTPGALIRVKAPRQMGKSSLMLRILDHAIQQGYNAVHLYFRQAEDKVFTSLEQLLQWLCTSIACKLDLDDPLSSHWGGELTSDRHCSNYFERYLLPKIASSLVLGLDDVDQILLRPQIATDFFGLLRAWHEQARSEPVWRKLRLVIAHSKEIDISLDDNKSPFNVGLPIDLPELNQAQVQDLVQQHGLNWTPEKVEQLVAMVGGHPYLVRVALYNIARERMTLADLLQIAPMPDGPYGRHLCNHLLNLKKDEDLITAMRQVIAASDPVRIETREALKLRTTGLVKFQGNDVMPLCNLYRLYLENTLISE